MHDRFVKNNEFLEQRRELLMSAIKVIDDVIAGKPFTTACRAQKVNYVRFHNFMNLQALRTLKQDSAVPLPDIVKFETSPYEKLYADVFGEENLAMGGIPQDVENTVENVLNTLTERERDIVLMYYGIEDGEALTYEQLGNVFGVTRERIRQVQAKAIRKLRHPNRARVLADGLAMYTLKKECEQREAEENLRILKEESDARIDAMRENLARIESGYFKEELLADLEPIDRAIMAWNKQDIADADLSVRSFNCLIRSGKKTILEMLSADDEELFNTRNMGKKSFEEIRSKCNLILAPYGLNRETFRAMIGKNGGEDNG